jgi:hypothetical protein
MAHRRWDLVRRSTNGSLTDATGARSGGRSDAARRRRPSLTRDSPCHNRRSSLTPGEDRLPPLARSGAVSRGEYSVNDFSRALGALPLCALPPSDEVSARHAARGARLLLAARSGLRRRRALRALASSARSTPRGATSRTWTWSSNWRRGSGADRDLLSVALNGPELKERLKGRMRRGARQGRLWFAVHDRRRRAILWR